MKIRLISNVIEFFTFFFLFPPNRYPKRNFDIVKLDSNLIGNVGGTLNFYMLAYIKSIILILLFGPI